MSRNTDHRADDYVQTESGDMIQQSTNFGAHCVA